MIRKGSFEEKSVLNIGARGGWGVGGRGRQVSVTSR